MLELQIIGNIWIGVILNRSNVISLLMDNLDVSINIAKNQLSSKGLYVKLTWIRNLYIDVSKRHIDYVARAFLLCLLGCTLFVDKTSNYVPVSYLTFLEI